MHCLSSPEMRGERVERESLCERERVLLALLVDLISISNPNSFPPLPTLLQLTGASATFLLNGTGFQLFHFLHPFVTTIQYVI